MSHVRSSLPRYSLAPVAKYRSVHTALRMQPTQRVDGCDSHNIACPLACGLVRACTVHTHGPSLMACSPQLSITYVWCSLAAFNNSPQYLVIQLESCRDDGRSGRSSHGCVDQLAWALCRSSAVGRAAKLRKPGVYCHIWSCLKNRPHATTT